MSEPGWDADTMAKTNAVPALLSAVNSVRLVIPHETAYEIIFFQEIFHFKQQSDHQSCPSHIFLRHP